MRPDYFIGLDLGQASDPTALAVVERPGSSRKNGEQLPYHLRHLHRFPLDTTYTAMINAVVKMIGDLRNHDSAVVVVDHGVGRAAIDMLRAAPIDQVVRVTITAGQTVSNQQDGSWHVPKKELVTSLQVLLQDQRLKIARDLPMAGTLIRELLNFRAKVSVSASETLEDWREGQHDDLVLAVALACWQAERSPRFGPDAITCGGRSLIADAPEGVFLS